MRRRGFVDGDGEWDHMGPEQDRQGSKCRQENQVYHIEWLFITVVANTGDQHDRCRERDRREDEQIRPVDLSVRELDIFSESVDEDGDHEDEHTGRSHPSAGVPRLPTVTSGVVQTALSAQPR
jgi:hypothetical protein